MWIRWILWTPTTTSFSSKWKFCIQELICYIVGFEWFRFCEILEGGLKFGAKMLVGMYTMLSWS